ncbi:MAG: methyltransferase domain-containing protein [Bacteroidota bacterium]
MNYKLLFPTYRNRHQFIRRCLRDITAAQPAEKMLNLGAGEGDYDSMIASFGQHLVSCDLNEADVAYAREFNKGNDKITYQVENGLDLSFPDNHFDVIVCIEVIEHVGDPEQLLNEIQRVLKPGGHLLMTFPRQSFPWTYDPINRFFAPLGQKRISQGAYAFGHDYLINDQEYNRWAAQRNFAVEKRRPLSRHFIGLLEVYWTGLVQQIFKSNTGNSSETADKGLRMRPSNRDPWLGKLVDLILALDEALFGWSKRSVGMGYVLQLKNQ